MYMHTHILTCKRAHTHTPIPEVDICNTCIGADCKIIIALILILLYKLRLIIIPYDYDGLVSLLGKNGLRTMPASVLL